VKSWLSAFRDRRLLFALLLVVLAANAAVLLSYRTFYDERLRALVVEQADLERRRDEARRKAEETAAAERKLFDTQAALTSFFTETLGEREKKIASLIEELYATTRGVGLRPDVIGYQSVDEPGTDSLTMSFTVEGPYRDVKRLLSELESSKRFLVVERVGLSGGSPDDPDSVRVQLTVTNYFRPGSLRPIRTVRDAHAGTAARRPTAATRGAGAAR
jgi:Tfp pilus assembly protein PilO